MKRNTTLLAGAVSACALALAPRAAQAAPAKPAQPAKPNIIFVLADDMGYGDLNCYGGKGATTKNIDRLAAEGVRFTQFYVGSPICSPSRTAFTTGQYPARWRITSFIEHRSSNAERGMAQWLDVRAPTLARSLQAAGYATGHFGKWHMGGGRDVGEAPLPTEYGFKASLTQFEGLGDRILPIMSAQGGEPAYKIPLGLASEKLGRGKVTWMPRSQVTKAFVNRALDFIKQSEKANQPFYINVWPDDVHSAFDPPQNLRGDGSKRALYEGVLTNMDAQLGPLFDAIRNDPKLRANTLVIFASDNGPEPGAGTTGGFRGSKGALYEGGIREPLIVWGPGFIPANRRGTVNTTSVVSAVDFAPTLLKLVGGKALANGDGIDMGAAFKGQAVAGRTQPLFWKRPPDRPGPARNPLPDLAVRDGNWKLLVQADGSRAQLYNLAIDANETKDLAATEPATVARLKNAVLAWNRTLPVVKIAIASETKQFQLKNGDHLARAQAPDVADRGFTITTQFNVSADAKAPVGVLVAQGGTAQGYSLYFDNDGKLTFLVRADGVATSIASEAPVTGSHKVVATLGSDRSLTLKLDDKIVAQGQAPKLIPTTPGDGLDVGSDQGSGVGPYEVPGQFNGTIGSVIIDLAAP